MSRKVPKIVKIEVDDHAVVVNITEEGGKPRYYVHGTYLTGPITDSPRGAIIKYNWIARGRQSEGARLVEEREVREIAERKRKAKYEKEVHLRPDGR